MMVAYGHGTFVQDANRFTGQIVLEEYRLCLRRDGEDLAPTFIVLDKIERIRRRGRELWIHVKPSLTLAYWAMIKGEARYMDDLTRELVARRGLSKRFLRREWVDTSFHEI